MAMGTYLFSSQEKLRENCKAFLGFSEQQRMKLRSNNIANRSQRRNCESF